MSRRKSQVVDEYVNQLLRKRDILARNRTDMDRDLERVEQELRSKYNDPNYGGRVKIRSSGRAVVPQDHLIGERVSEKLDKMRSQMAIASLQKEETAIEVTDNPAPEIVGLDTDTLMRVVKASINISDCFFDGTTKEQRQQLLSDIERAVNG